MILDNLININFSPVFGEVVVQHHVDWFCGRCLVLVDVVAGVLHDCHYEILMPLDPPANLPWLSPDLLWSFSPLVSSIPLQTLQIAHNPSRGHLEIILPIVNQHPDLVAEQVLQPMRVLHHSVHCKSTGNVLIELHKGDILGHRMPGLVVVKEQRVHNTLSILIVSAVIVDIHAVVGVLGGSLSPYVIHRFHGFVVAAIPDMHCCLVCKILGDVSLVLAHYACCAQERLQSVDLYLGVYEPTPQDNTWDLESERTILVDHWGKSW